MRTKYIPPSAYIGETTVEPPRQTTWEYEEWEDEEEEWQEEEWEEEEEGWEEEDDVMYWGDEPIPPIPID